MKDKETIKNEEVKNACETFFKFGCPILKDYDVDYFIFNFNGLSKYAKYMLSYYSSVELEEIEKLDSFNVPNQAINSFKETGDLSLLSDNALYALFYEAYVRVYLGKTINDKFYNKYIADEGNGMTFKKSCKILRNYIADEFNKRTEKKLDIDALDAADQYFDEQEVMIDEFCRAHS